MPVTRRKRSTPEAKAEGTVPSKVKKKESASKSSTSKRSLNKNLMVEPKSPNKETERKTNMKKGKKTQIKSEESALVDGDSRDHIAKEKKPMTTKRKNTKATVSEISENSIVSDKVNRKKKKIENNLNSETLEQNNKGNNSQSSKSLEISDNSDDDDDFVDVDPIAEPELEVKPKSSNGKGAKQPGGKTIRKTSVSGEVVTKAKRKRTKTDNKTPSQKKSERRKSSKTKNSEKKTVTDSELHAKLLKEDDVAKVLMHMEGQSTSKEGPGAMDNGNSSKEEFFSSEESDWEEVADHAHSSPRKSQLPNGPVQIRLDVPDIMKKKRKRKEFDWKAYFNRIMNRFKKNSLIQMHKIHLLCLLSHGLHCVHLGKTDILQAQALSLTTTNILKTRPFSYSIQSLTTLTKWFVSLVTIDSKEKPSRLNLNLLVQRFSTQKVASGKELVLLFFTFLTVLGLDVRIIFSFQPLPWKAPTKDTEKPTKTKAASRKNTSNKSTDNSSKIEKEKSSSKNSKTDSESQKLSKKSSKESQNQKKKAKLKKKLKDETNSSSGESDDEPVKENSRSRKNKDSLKTNRAKNTRQRSCASKVTPSKAELDLSGEEEEMSCDSDYSNYSDEETIKKTKQKKGIKETARKSKNALEKSSTSSETQDLSSDEFEKEDIKLRTSPGYTVNRKYKGKAVSKKVVSSDSEESSSSKYFQNGQDFWIEVYLETEKKWICVDVVRNTVDKPESMEKLATQPICYVVAFDNRGCVKDVTCRYASQWMSHTRKLRIEADWWEETLLPYKSKNKEREEHEDMVMKAHLMKQPLPQVIGEYKNHPLYALRRRHLLKFEAIYPETALPLGYIRKEPVFARECVHTLHSRDNWLKEGRVVKLGESAYKMVKSRPKWNKPKENPDELDLEIFGEWQTEIYVPPPAKDGKIYKNEYGNIELFQPSMLPEGTVHIRVEGLKKVAKKLDLACVPAMVGWEHHSGFAHPILDGFVVCKEHEDILLSAWEEDQEEQRKREEMKREKRIYGNWKIFVRGLLIKERLKRRFELENPTPVDQTSGDTGLGEKATDTAVSWPRNRQKKTKKKTQPKSTECLVDVEQL